MKNCRSVPGLFLILFLMFGVSSYSIALEVPVFSPLRYNIDDVLYANEPPVHGWIALQAYKLLVEKYKDTSAIVIEFKKYLPTDENDLYYFQGFSTNTWTENDYSENEAGPQGTALIEGAYEEDGHLNWSLDEERTKHHFWDPDDGFNKGLAGFNSALYTAINGSSEIPSRFKNALDNFNPQSTDNRVSFYWLGRTAHLLMDMTVPDHAHNDQHLWGDSSYETYVAARYREIRADTMADKNPIDIASLPLQVPPDYTETMPYAGDGLQYKDSQLVRLFFNSAQFAQFFDSDNYNGNDVNADAMKNQWNLTAANGLTNQPKNYLHPDSRFDWDKPVAVYWEKSFRDGSRDLIEHTDFFLSRARGCVYLSDEVYAEANSHLFDTFRVSYTKDGQDYVNNEVQIYENYSDIWDDVLVNTQNSLQTHAIKATATLYELFWKMTHPYTIEGTLGTTLTISGSGFGTKKGKVLIGGIAAKVVEDGWSDIRITCTVNKPPLPAEVAHPVAVVVNKVSITLDDTFTLKNPSLDDLLDSRGKPPDEITVTGLFFGVKKGKVYLEDPVSRKKKTCKVTYWHMNPATGESELKFLVPKPSKSFPAGSYPLKIDNKIGKATSSTNFTLEPLP